MKFCNPFPRKIRQRKEITGRGLEKASGRKARRPRRGGKMALP